LVNLDFADIKAVMSDGGVSLIGVGESDSNNRAIEAVDKALNNPLISVDISGASGALINVSGSKDLTLNEAKQVVESISLRLSNDAKIIWGAQIYEDLESTMRVMLIVTGVHSPQIMGGRAERSRDKRAQDVSHELGIEFIRGS